MMRWKNNQRSTGWDQQRQSDWLVDNEGTILAEIEHPDEDMYIPLYHYNCRHDCHDNLASVDRAHLKRHARKHQREAHGEA